MEEDPDTVVFNVQENVEENVEEIDNSPKLSKGRRNDTVAETVYQTAIENPGMSNIMIAEIVKQKLNRESLSICRVGEILRRNNIFSPAAKRRQEVRETVLEIWKDCPEMDPCEISEFASQKLKRKVGEKVIAEIIRTNNSHPDLNSFSQK